MFHSLKYYLWSLPLFRRWSLRALWPAGRIWRTLMFRTRIVAVTGSLGKTTAKELLTAILSTQARTVATKENQSDRFGVPRTLLRIRPWHRFAVVEAGVGAPGQMAGLARLIRPHVALFVCVERTHSTHFSDLDAHAAEKGELLGGLDRQGICVANGEDVRTRRIAEGWGGRTVRFGQGAGSDLTAERISSRWPERLRFRLRYSGDLIEVQTRLVGTHWINSVLGAIAAAGACGVSPQNAADAVSSVDPFPGRLQPMELPGGAILLRDDYNASWTALSAALEVFRNARAKRRILVLSDFSDFQGNRKARLRYLAQQIGECADHFFLISAQGDYFRRRCREAGISEDRILSCDTQPAAAEMMKQLLQPGDLVLLKGRTTDHVTRVYFRIIGTIGCSRNQCKKTVLCDFCPELRPSVRS